MPPTRAASFRVAGGGALAVSFWVGRLLARGERAGAVGVLLAFAAVAVLTRWRELD